MKRIKSAGMKHRGPAPTKVPKTPKVEQPPKINPEAAESTNIVSEPKGNMPAWMNKHFSEETGKRLAVAAGVGAVAGIGASILNNQDDTISTTAERTIKYAALGVGVSYGAELGLNAIGVTSKHYAEKQILQKSHKVLTDEEKLRWHKNRGRKAHVAGVVGLGAFSVATLMDVGAKLKEDRVADIAHNKAEQELAKKMTTEKQKQAQMGYGYVDYGQVVLEQFEKRIGHYAMGNARFN